MKEVWKPVKGYEGLYEVSNLGRVKSLKRMVYHYFSKGYIQKDESIIGQTNHKKGYLSATLTNIDGTKKTYLIHRLVAMAFLPIDKKRMHVNHIDGNKKNNRIDNIEWCTPKENTEHARKNKLLKPPKGEKVYTSKLNADKVRQIRKLKAEKNYTNKKLSEMFGVDSSQISRLLNGVFWSHVK